jgi:deazaflavin-dependent oxidoreductase (nitroreductase family)
VAVIRWLGRLVGVVMVAFGALFAVLLIGMRTKSPAVLDRVRRFNRNVTNPRVLRTAGAPGASASVIRHVGRVSGRPYETPVGPVAVGDDYVIALPYGPETDWVRNVIAAGGATLVHEGRQVSVDRPEVVATSAVVDDLPASERRTLRIFGVAQCLRVRTASAELPA